MLFKQPYLRYDKAVGVGPADFRRSPKKCESHDVGMNVSGSVARTGMAIAIGH